MDGDGGAQWVKWGEIIRKEEVIRLWARFIQPARLQVIAYADFTVKAPASGLSLLLSLLMESIRTLLVGEIGLKSEVSDPPLCSRLESDASAVATSVQSSPSSSLMLSSSLFLFQSPLSQLSTVQVSSGLLFSCSPNITPPPWIPPWIMHISLNKSPL